MFAVVVFPVMGLINVSSVVVEVIRLVICIVLNSMVGVMIGSVFGVFVSGSELILLVSMMTALVLSVVVGTMLALGSVVRLYKSRGTVVNCLLVVIC